MTQKQLINTIAQKFYLIKTESKEILNFIFEKITDNLKQGKRFYLRGFGSFRRETRASKKVRHPRTGKIITIPQRITINFTPAKNLLQKVKVGNPT